MNNNGDLVKMLSLVEWNEWIFVNTADIDIFKLGKNEEKEKRDYYEKLLEEEKYNDSKEVAEKINMLIPELDKNSYFQRYTLKDLEWKIFINSHGEKGELCFDEINGRLYGSNIESSLYVIEKGERESFIEELKWIKKDLNSYYNRGVMGKGLLNFEKKYWNKRVSNFSVIIKAE